MSIFESQSTEFRSRHIGPNPAETKEMLDTIGVSSLEALIDQTIPAAIRFDHPLALPAVQNEFEYLHELKKVARRNKVFKSYIGQ